MKKIYVAKASWDAQMVHDLLVTAGIEALIDPPSDGFKTPYSLLSHRGSSQAVWILRDEDEPRAEAVVGEFRVDASRGSEAPGFVWTWRCARCAENVEPQFEICWNCGAERPEE